MVLWKINQIADLKRNAKMQFTICRATTKFSPCAQIVFSNCIIYYTHTNTHTRRHTHTGTQPYTQTQPHTNLCVFIIIMKSTANWAYKCVDDHVSVRTCVCVCVCVWERPFVSMIMQRVIQLTFYSFTSTRLGPTLALHLCLGFVFISLNLNSIKSGSCKSYDISHSRVQSNTKDYNYGYISVQMQSCQW